MNNQIYNYYFNIQQTFFIFFLFQNSPTDWTTDKTGMGLPGTLVFPVLYRIQFPGEFGTDGT